MVVHRSSQQPNVTLAAVLTGWLNSFAVGSELNTVCLRGIVRYFTSHEPKNAIVQISSIEKKISGEGGFKEAGGSTSVVRAPFFLFQNEPLFFLPSSMRPIVVR